MKRMILFLYAFKFYLYNKWITHIPLYTIRRWYLNQVIHYRIDSSAAIHMGCFFTGAYLVMGRNSVLNRNCYLDCREGITIGENVSISPECYLLTAGHDAQSSYFSGKNKPLVIMDYSWLGARALILPGCTIGKGAIVAAGSVVVKPVTEYTIVGGNPAVFIKTRNFDLQYQLSWFPFFNTDIN